VVKGKPVAEVKTAAEGVPKFGVTKVGEVEKTKTPVPVSSVKAESKFAELNEPNDVALPTEVTAPVRFALVVTVDALPFSAPTKVVAVSAFVAEL
jgi:hypothetical protein